MKLTKRISFVLLLAALLAVPTACSDDGVTTPNEDPPAGDPPTEDPPADPPADPPVDPPPSSDEIVLTEFASGLQRPVQLLSAPGDSRLFIVEQRGLIRVLSGEQFQAAPYLDLRGQLSDGSEQGLLGMAFHPDFQVNGFAFVNYTDGSGDTRVVRYTEQGDGLSLDSGSAKEILFVDQPAGNHNAGQLLFGGDGMLYVPLGDGGSSGDPQGNGQNLNTLLGAILRIDVDSGDPYAIPPDNPFAAGRGRAEIWAYGVRNPWRNDIDIEGGYMYVADVGQNTWEEVSVVALGEAGVNFGWNVIEGPDCFQSATCNDEGFRSPAVVYDHGDGCSITGGHVYRGQAIPDLVGTYFYSDFCSGWLRSFRWDPAQGAAVDQREWAIPRLSSVYSFGKDADGELYVLAGSRAYRIDPAP